MAEASPSKFPKLNPNYWYIDGVAYDLEPFVKSHPGGQYAIYLGKGRECLGLLHSYHLTVPPKSMFEKYRVAAEHQLPDPEKNKFAPLRKFTFDENGFLATAKRKAVEHFRKHKRDHHADWANFIFFFVNVGLILLSMWGMCTMRTSVLSVLAVAIFHGIMRALLVVQTTHGASHFAFVKSPMGNRWAYRIGTVLIGLWAPPVWDIQHVVAHHVWTSEWPYDSDSAFPLKSILYNQKRYWYHKYQHIYMWLVYAFTIPLVMLNSLKDIIIQRQVTFKMNFYAPHAKTEAWACALGSLLYCYLPLLFQDSFSRAAWIIFISNLTSSLYFSLQFVVNHEVDSLIQPGPFKEGVDWGEYQVRNSLTFNGDSWLGLHMAGGLNTQIEHHIFPGVHYSHYHDMRRIIKETCKEFGVAYTERDTLLDALKGHYLLLKHPPKSIRERKQ